MHLLPDDGPPRQGSPRHSRSGGRLRRQSTSSSWSYQHAVLPFRSAGTITFDHPPIKETNMQKRLGLALCVFFVSAVVCAESKKAIVLDTESKSVAVVLI